MRHLLGLILCCGVLFISVNCEVLSQCQGIANGTYIKGTQAQSFIYCNGNRSYAADCPLGLTFDPLDGGCANRKQNATASVVCPTDEISFIANKDSPTEYFACMHGKPIPMTCSGEQHFNPLTQKCESPLAADSIPTPNSGSTGTIPTWNPTGSTPTPTWGPTGTRTTWAQTATTSTWVQQAQHQLELQQAQHQVQAQQIQHTVVASIG